TSKYYKELCNYLQIKYPTQCKLLLDNNNNGNWRANETYYYHFNDDKTLLFPYFNNGAVLIHNSISKQVGIEWEKNRLKAFQGNFVPNLGQAGELTIGLTINNITDNWKIFPRGFNLVCSQTTKKYINCEYTGNIYLIHYVQVNYMDPIFLNFIKPIY